MKYILSQPQAIYELGQRKNQEDAIFPKKDAATPNDRLFIVCDGMGGHEGGEVASNTVCEELSNYILQHSSVGGDFTNIDFQRALDATYDAIDKKDNGAEKKMGTTLTLLKFHSNGCLAAHIGDSRIYQIRPSKRQILYKSRDHSLVNDLYDIGEITLEEMKTSNQKNVITRAIQPNQPRRAKAEIRQLTDIESGDYFYICSDGMLEEMEDENLINIICDNETSDEEKKRILTEVTKENRDNHSAYLVCVKEVINASDTLLASRKSEPVGSGNKKLSPKRVSTSPKRKKNDDGQTFQIIAYLAIALVVIAIIAVFLLNIGG